MSDDELPTLLARVRERLTHADSTDPRVHQRLTEVLKEMPPVEGSLPPREGIAAQVGLRLERLAVNFEAEHPKVAAMLREVVEELEQGGI